MKTLKQIADELGVDKQRVYRFVKQECINEVHHDAHQSKSAKYYDEVAEKAIKEHFKGLRAEPKVHHEAHHDAAEVHHDAVEAHHEALLNQIRADHLAEIDRIAAAHEREVKALEASLADVTAERDRLREELAQERQHSREREVMLAQIADQSQRLQLAQMQPPALLEDEKHKPSIWERLFGKKIK